MSDADFFFVLVMAIFVVNEIPRIQWLWKEWRKYRRTVRLERTR